MSTLNKRLSGPSQLTNAAATQYTSPAGTVTIVQQIQVTNNDVSVARGFSMSIGADAAGTRQYDSFLIQPNGVLSVFVKFVLQPAEIIQAFASVNGALTLTLDGQQLTAG